MPIAERRNRATRTTSSGHQHRTQASSTTAEPETPLDWSRIESALQSTRHQTRETAGASRLAALENPQPKPAPRRIDAHRKNLEDEGVESGKRVQQEYRKEVIQLNRALVEQRSQDPEEDQDSVSERWMERFGEQLGDFLSEPSAGHIIAILAALTVFIALGFAYVLS